MAEHAQALLRSAWEQSYLNPLRARELGRSVAEMADADLAHAAEGWLHVALAEVRAGDAQVAAAALAKAREGYLAAEAAAGAVSTATATTATGLALCDEVQAIALRRQHDHAGAARLQAELDQREGVQRDAMHRFLGHNSRAITAKLLGDPDAALRHFYAASDAAGHTGWDGPRLTALSNLGGYHQDLYNLDDARRLSEQALAAARAAGARQIVATSASNLIIIYHACGEAQLAHQMGEFMHAHAHELLPGALTRYALPLALAHLSAGDVAAALRLLDAGAISAVADGDGITSWAWLKARCLLATGDAAGARAVAESTLQQRRDRGLLDQAYDMMELHKALADACERTGDAQAALACMREAYARHEQLVGRSARARYIALDVNHQLAAAQRERDLALDSQRSAEDDRQRLADLNRALQAQIEETDKLHTQLREQALNDPLTGLHNRRYLFEVAPGVLDLARRQSLQVCVVLIDLDHFKLLNDTYGHQAGDLVLQRFSHLLKQMLRRSDVVCRHGGEEFVAVMPDIDGDDAQAMLVRLLEAFQALPQEPGRRRTPNGSFSAGIALFPRHGNTLEQLLSRADRALYAAKNLGRARIEQVPRTGFGTLS